jgi:hypothetical protein
MHDFRFTKPKISVLVPIYNIEKCLDNHLRGELCSNCEDVIVTEMGKLLFYSAALCNTLDLNLYDVFLEEYKKASTLGVFNLT